MRQVGLYVRGSCPRRSRLRVDADGQWLLPVVRRVSPNCDDRPPGVGVDLVVIHGISLPPGQFGSGDPEALFLNRLDWGGHPFYQEIKGLRVSSHVMIERCGRIVQFVPFHRRAWHAGESVFLGRPRCNDFSVGIELEGDDHTAYDPAQYAALEQLLSALREAFPHLDADRVAGHCHIAPGRKTDPGPSFEWDRVAACFDAPAGWRPPES